MNLPFSFLLSQRYEGRGCCFDRIIETYIFYIDRLKNVTDTPVLDALDIVLLVCLSVWKMCAIQSKRDLWDETENSGVSKDKRIGESIFYVYKLRLLSGTNIVRFK